MSFTRGTARAPSISFRLAMWLATGSFALAAIYTRWHHHSAWYVIPAYFIAHAVVCLWAAQQAFASTGPGSGCRPGVTLWLALTLEFFLLWTALESALRPSH
jgi:hypothetical protein